MSEIIPTVAGYVADLGVDAGKNIIKKKYDEKKLRESLTSYIERQKKYNDVCSLAEEIDFQGLIEYIRDNFQEQVLTRITSLNPKDREKARQSIVDAAVSFSKVDTGEARLRVGKNISVCLDILKDFYKKKIDAQYYILASEVVDAVNENTASVAAESTMSITKKIDDQADRIVSEIKKASLFSIDSLVGSASQGNFDYANDKLKLLMNQLSASPPLFPDYGFDWKDGNLISMLLSVEANVKYPQKYCFTGSVKVGNKYVTDPSLDVFNYAYRHQLQLVMKVEEAKKYLGDIIDPIQYDVAKLVGGELHAKPPEFPPAFACSIKVKDQVCFEYVLIRTQEILDDGTYIFSNKEQSNTHLRFEFRANIKDLLQNAEGEVVAARGDTGFKISIQDGTNAEILKYIKFIRTVTTERDLRLHVLENDQDLVAGKIDNTDYSTGFKDIDEEIDFLERVCDIEKYFNVSLHIEGDISEKEYHTILLVSDLIRHDEIEETWTTASFTGILDDRFRQNLIEIGAEMGAISYVATSYIDIFNTHIELKFMRTFYDAIMVDHERIVKLAELSKEGDPIKITFKAGENNKATSTLNIPKKMDVEETSEDQSDE